TLEVHPKSYCTYFTMGVAFADAQMFRDAIRCWDKVAELGPHTPEAESASESMKLLKEYIGSDSQPAAALNSGEGIPPGAGGPAKALPGGAMNGDGGKAPRPKKSANDGGAKPGSTK